MTATVADSTGKVWEVIESLPAKQVKGGCVVASLVREIVSAGPQAWAIYAEQRRDGLDATTRCLPQPSESDARTKFESYR